MKIPVSFKKEEGDLYKFIKSKRNASVYIKDLVEEDMNNTKGAKNKPELINKERINGNLEIDF